MEVERWIRELHDLAVGNPGEQITSAAFGQPQVLSTLREGPAAARAPLAALAATLPLREAFVGAVPELTRALEDRRALVTHRQALYEKLAQLGHLDAYLQAAGLAPAYRVAPLLSRYVPQTTWALGAAPPEPAAPARDSDPAPGTYGLFEWARAEDRSFPFLFAEGLPLAPPELLQVSAAQAAVGTHAWTLDEHRAAVGRFHLQRPGRYGGVHLLVDFANLIPPHVLRVMINGMTIDYHPDPASHREILWRDDPSWWRLALALPEEVLETGWNRVRVETAPLRGMPRWEGVWLHAVQVRLDP